MILDQIESCKQYIDLTKPVKDVTKADIKKLRVQKRKLENAIFMMRNVKVDNYVKIKRVGI